MKAQGSSVTEEEIVATFAHLPREKVVDAFSSNRQTLVLSGSKTRFHIDNFQLEDIDKMAIVNFLSKEIVSMQYVTFAELFGKITEIAPRVIKIMSNLHRRVFALLSLVCYQINFTSSEVLSATMIIPLALKMLSAVWVEVESRSILRK